jgi:parvulin-like peptidyl-prolyl isomerase
MPGSTNNRCRRSNAGLLVTSAALLFVLSTVGLSSLAAATELNRVVLRVNDRIATLYDYERMRQERIAALSRAGAEIPEAELQQRLAMAGVTVMKELFDELLVLSRADQLGFRAEQSDLQRSIEQTKQNFGIETEEEFERALVANGMTRESFLDQIEENLLIRQVMSREVYSQVSVEEEDLRRYYQQNPDDFRVPARRLLREVVVLDAGRSADDVEQSGRELRQAVLDGDADAAVAATEEAGISTGWIDLGWIEVGDLDEDLEAALADLSPGDVSRPTPGRGGLHVIQVLEVQEARVRDFNEVSEQIETRLTNERFGEALQDYMRDLEANAYIESDPPPEAAGFRSERSADSPRDALLESALSGEDASRRKKQMLRRGSKIRGRAPWRSRAEPLALSGDRRRARPDHKPR